MRPYFIFFLVSIASYGQVTVSPSDPNLLYTGRVEMTNPEAPVFSLNGVSIKANFSGTAISGTFSATKSSYLYIIVDGNDDPYTRKVLEVSGSNPQQLVLVSDLTEGTHTIEIVKLDESDSKVTFHGLEIVGVGLLEKPGRPELKLEFIGDSNTAGWNAWNAYDNGGNEASGAYHTFPGMVSRMLGAEFSLIGASGSGITDRASWNCTRVWDRIHLQEQTSESNEWNFEDNYWGFTPDAVIVNLGANDYYAGASKELIKSSWKAFIKGQLRAKYPDAHIVLANSYGWAYNEPADYVNEAIEELISEGETNVSFIRFPWLWGQAHTVVNEHAGFANLLASHLAEVLELDEPEALALSSFAEKGMITNGSFEKSVLPSMADGWRPNGTISVVENGDEAIEGNNFMRTQNGGYVNFATEVVTGTMLTLTGWAKGGADSHTGFFKLLFKDQAQNTLSSKQIQPDFKEEWEEFTVEARVPADVWSVWVVLESAQGSVIDFDNISLTASDPLGVNTLPNEFKLFPNPFKHQLTVECNDYVNAYDSNGRFMMRLNKGSHELSSWKPGAYLFVNADRTISKRIIKE